MNIKEKVNRLKRVVKVGVDRVAARVVESITRGKGGLAYWDQLGYKGRLKVRKDIEEAVREEILDRGLKRALAESVLDEFGVPRFANPLYEYLKRELYKGDVRRLMVDLNEWRNDD